MTFGALKPCPKCKQGQLVFRSGVGYYCLGQDQWAKCDSVFDNPARKAFVVPDDLKEEYDFLYVPALLTDFSLVICILIASFFFQKKIQM
jgi:ssDNA-binding Zn-finger/Zn-ribbon topoisomerase 1